MKRFTSHRPMAGIWHEITSAITPVKTEAHRSAKEAAAAGDIHNFLGNDWADRWAKRGAQLHHVTKDQVNNWKQAFVYYHADACACSSAAGRRAQSPCCAVEWSVTET